jgi:uncharacterized membrane protein
LLLAIVLLASILRLAQLDSVPAGLYSGEAINGSTALEVIRTGEYRVYYREDNGREGLFVAVLTMVLRLIPLDEPWVLRLAPAAMGILTVPGLYLLGKELFSRPAGLFAAFFLASSFWHVVFSRIAFRAIFAPLLSVWAIYFLLVALRPGQPALRARGSAALAGLLFGLGFYTYIAYRVSPLLLLVFVPLFWNQRAVALTFLGSAFAVASPIGWFFLQHPEEFSRRASQVSLLVSPEPLVTLIKNVLLTVAMLFVYGDTNWRHNLRAHPELFAPVAILLVVGLVAGIQRLRPRRPIVGAADAETFAFRLVFAWMAIGFLPVALTGEGTPHAMRSIFMIPAVFLLAGVGAARVWHALERQSARRAVAVTAALAVLITVHVSVTYFMLWGRHPQVAEAFAAGDVAVARAINALPPELPKYVVVEPLDRDVNDLPFAAYPVMFMTRTYTQAERAGRRITYLRPDQVDQIPAGAATFYVTGR